MNVNARDIFDRPAILAVGIWFALTLAESTLRAEPLSNGRLGWRT
jgi:hypothetical protein